MAYFSLAEQLRLVLVRPELVATVHEVMQAFEDATGYRTYVPEYGGIRSRADQQHLLDERAASGERYDVGGVDTSRHVYGAAIDLHILEPDGRTAVSPDSPLYQQLADIAERYGLESGYYFPDRYPGRGLGRDPFHLQLREPLAASRAEFDALRGRALQRAALLAGAGTLVLILIHFALSRFHGERA